MSRLLTTLAARSAFVRRPVAARRCSRPTSRRKSASTGRPTIRSRWCSRSKGLLEKEFAKDGIDDPLGADARLQQGAGISQRRLDRFRLDRRLGGAGRQDQRQPDQVDLRLFAPRMDRAGDAQGHGDHQGRGPQGQARRGDARHRSAHLPGARAARRRPDREGRQARAAAASGRQAPRSSAATSTPGPASIR